MFCSPLQALLNAKDIDIDIEDLFSVEYYEY